MTDQQAERWVITSALVVAGIYAYRRTTETPGQPPVTVPELAGVGELPPLGAWATAWGFTFLVVSIIAQAAPELGAGFAILIATGDLLTNSASVFKDVGQQEASTAAAGTVSPATLSAAAGSNLFDTSTGVGVYQPPTGIPAAGTTILGSGAVKPGAAGKPLP